MTTHGTPWRPPHPIEQLPEGCPDDRSACTRVGCKWWAGSTITKAGTIKLGTRRRDGVTLPVLRDSDHTITEADVLEAVDYVADQAEAGLGCSLELAKLGGLTQEETGEAMGLGRQAVALIERRALAKVGPQLERLGLHIESVQPWEHGAYSARKEAA